MSHLPIQLPSKLQTKLFVSSNKYYGDTNVKFTVVRYGNVNNSRGSVIPLIINQIKNGYPITITNKNMTRFLMTLDDALELVFHAFEKGTNSIFYTKTNKQDLTLL